MLYSTDEFGNWRLTYHYLTVCRQKNCVRCKQDGSCDECKAGYYKDLKGTCQGRCKVDWFHTVLLIIQMNTLLTMRINPYMINLSERHTYIFAFSNIALQYGGVHRWNSPSQNANTFLWQFHNTAAINDLVTQGAKKPTGHYQAWEGWLQILPIFISHCWLLHYTNTHTDTDLCR